MGTFTLAGMTQVIYLTSKSLWEWQFRIDSIECEIGSGYKIPINGVIEKMLVFPIFHN